MSEPILGEIRMFGFNFAPRGWAFCDGQIMSISQNTALFSLLGTTYGGDGKSTFALPDLRGRMANHRSGETFIQGQTGGTVIETLTIQQVPIHHHNVLTNATGNVALSSGHYPATGPENNYATTHDTTLLNPGTISTSGGGKSHNNMPPYLTLIFCIALQGIFPSRN